VGKRPTFEGTNHAMQYLDNIEESRQYLRIALELIGKHGLPTDPLNYCIWYEYASEKNEALNTAIDEYLETNPTLSETAARQFFKQFIAGSTESLTLLVTQELKEIFIEIIGAIKATNNHFSASENHLDNINQSMVPGLSEADIDKIVSQIKSEIQILESSNTSFKEQLRQATQEIDQLRAKMARYRSEALRDPLTRIDNRRGFEKKLNQAIADANSTGTSLCLIMADIDHFKQVNDTHGHLVGDNLLRMVAATIKDSIKGKDMAARIGGEEFAMILPDTPFDGAMKLADNIRLTFERLDLKKKNTGESLGKITLSFGVGVFKKNETADAFMNRADKALYQSKNKGRNTVTGL